MAIIKTIPPDQAQGQVKEIYGAILEKIPFVPKPLQLMSASPDLLATYSRTMDYFMGHPNLSPLLMAYIRMLSAFHSDYPYCIDLNSNFLKQFAGLTDEQLAAIRSDASQAPLDEKEKALLVFVIKSIQSPEDVDAGDMDQLHALGWADPDIFDALYHGASMVSTGILFNSFKMGDV